MVKMVPSGKKSDPVDVLPQSVETMERKGWKRVDAPVRKKKVKDDGEP